MVEAEGIGNVQIRVVLEDGHVENSVPCDVLYIKELAMNLLPVSATANKGHNVSFSKNTTLRSVQEYLYDTRYGEGQVTCCGVTQSNLWSAWYMQLLTQQLWPVSGRPLQMCGTKA